MDWKLQNCINFLLTNHGGNRCLESQQTRGLRVQAGRCLSVWQASQGPESNPARKQDKEKKPSVACQLNAMVRSEKQQQVVPYTAWPSLSSSCIRKVWLALHLLLDS